MENAALAPTFDSVDLHPGCQCAVTGKWDLLDPLHLLHRPGALGEEQAKSDLQVQGVNDQSHCVPPPCPAPAHTPGQWHNLHMAPSLSNALILYNTLTA